MNKKYELVYLCFLSSLGIEAKVKESQKQPYTIWQKKQTLGVTFLMQYSSESGEFWIEQKDINNKTITKGSFPPKNEVKKLLNAKKASKAKGKESNIVLFSLNRKYGDCKQIIEVFPQESIPFLKVKTKNNNGPVESHISNNIYSLFNDILSDRFSTLGKIRNGRSPDYYKEENEIIFTKPGMENLYKIYYALNGKYKIYNSFTYINEQINLTMGQVLTIFGVPAIYFHGGNGEEIFVYLGIHLCQKTNEIYYGMLIFSFDILNICRTVAYIIEKCPKCHGNLSQQLNVSSSYIENLTTEDGLYFFKLDMIN